ncbi:FAD/NAD(P)-binding domain-containing protein [Aspergillus desertorum]
MGEASKQTVAVVGSGMAGLVAAFLIQRDSKCRYSVEVFEKQDQLSLDSASCTLETAADGHARRVDIPMRAFDDNYHINLKRMYDYFGVDYTSPKFLYSLSRFSSSGKREPPYFIHSSSNHRVPPIRPRSRSRVDWILETIYLAICYFWFTACCFLVGPGRTAKSLRDESLLQYLERIRLPQYFSRHYLLPLLASMTTCSHVELLEFPAIDVLDYAKRTYRRPHYTVVGGIRRVQSRISEGLVVRLNSSVTAVESVGTRCRITWADSQGDNVFSKEYDHVIMAVTPDVVAAIFKPLENVLQQIPIAKGECIVHRDTSVLPEGNLLFTEARKGLEQPEIMYMFTDNISTESVHQHPSSVFVTNFPIAPIESNKIIHRARLTRVLRSLKSREVVNSIFSARRSEHVRREKGQLWRNGDGNVWLVGAWCWDGMVLLEGCVVSAMRVAACLGVDIPWLNEE